VSFVAIENGAKIIKIAINSFKSILDLNVFSRSVSMVIDVTVRSVTLSVINSLDQTTLKYPNILLRIHMTNDLHQCTCT